jgi:5-methylcytosine-specific restriction endonuclease McrA
VSHHRRCKRGCSTRRSSVASPALGALDRVIQEQHGYIQIHHIKPVSEYEGEVDPETDLVPLCANCHAMAHRRRVTVTSIDDLKALIENAKG